jgi:hypothetical protein
MQPSAALVMTTIADPEILEDYRRNFEKFGHLNQVKVFIIPDRKTPAGAYERCAQLRRSGMQVVCPTMEEQETYLRQFGNLARLIPYNSDNRRNVAFLMALESGAEFMMSIDDDNFCLPDEDFFAGHSVARGDVVSGNEVHSSNGWFNICEMMEVQPAVNVYPRGFPYYARHQSVQISQAPAEGKVHMNAGLWLSEPDVDAMTWLVTPVRTIRMKGDSILLGDKAWSPINTQNTGLSREVIVAYYFVRMGYPLGGMPIDRFGDIVSGYFSQVCVRHLGNKIRVGSPVAEHRRNSHNYMRDAANEFACIWALEDVLQWLVNVRLEGSNYTEAYTSLAGLLEDAVESFTGTIWNDATRGYFHQMAYCMRQWIAACKVLN